ncbi:MAG: enoyl-CoA hydratase-related protein [Pseudomonadota bacterium]
MTDGPRLSIDGDLATITLDRPEKRNALTMADLAGFAAALDKAAAAPDLRALVVTGAGDRAFSAGVDLSDVGGGAESWAENPLTALCDRLEAFPRPTIARLNGPVVGGAAEISLSCDFRIGADHVSLLVPAARIGVHYETEGLRRAVAGLGLQGARRVYLLAEKLDAAALDALGYFDARVPAEALDDAVAAMAAQIRGGAPLAVDGMKRTLTELARGAPDAGAATARIRAAWASEDMAEGLAALREKRAPKFRGR